MTNVKDVFGQGLLKNLLGKELGQFYVGFNDRLDKLNELQEAVSKNLPSYPPYNVRKLSDSSYVIELAVAGFESSDIEVTLDNNKLIIKGALESGDDSEYLYRGIGMRPFTRVFAVEDTIEVQGAGIVNGMLKIFLDKIVPEEKSAKKIQIKSI